MFLQVRKSRGRYAFGPTKQDVSANSGQGRVIIKSPLLYRLSYASFIPKQFYERSPAKQTPAQNAPDPTVVLV
jgi:hypothetical protein